MIKRISTITLMFLLIVSVSALTVEELTDSMLVNSPDIRKAREEVSKALLDVKDAKAGYAPTIDLTVTGSYIANPIDPISVNLGDYVNTTAYGVRNDYIQIYKGQESMYYQFQLSLTQPIFTWGKLSKAVDLYQEIHQARVIQLDDAIEKARTELRTRVAALHHLILIRAVLDEQKSISDRLVELAQKAQENGMMLSTEALGVKVQASQIDVAKSQIDQQITLMMTELRNLSGIADLSENDIEFDAQAFESDLEDLRSQDYNTLCAKCLSDSRTTFKLLGKLSNIASLTKGIAGASVNWKPDFALVVNADFTGSRLPFVEKDWYGQDDWGATITIAMKTTVFDGGKAVRNVSRTGSDVAEAEIDVLSAKNQVQSAVDENWTNLFVCLSQMDYQNALAQQQDEQSKVDKDLLDTGYGSESDYLQGRLERNNCEIEILRTRISLATSLYTLKYLEGTP
ncbi:MAG: TolC family protein [Spirochaetales bacterium]|nr:TolC family protein [Spirochaetales bacterium]